LDTPIFCGFPAHLRGKFINPSNVDNSLGGRFVEAFEREYGGKDWVDMLARRGGSRTARSLGWLVSEMIKNGLWAPGSRG